MHSRAFIAAFLAACLSTLTPAWAQAPTGSISGRVESSDGLPLPGVTVSLTSPHLQGVRSTITTESGDYHMPLLPPGIYRVAFELTGFQTATRTESLSGTQRVTVDIRMALAAIAAEVEVVGQAQPFAATAQVSTSFKQGLMETLPTNRTIEAVALMAPSVHATGPRGALSISGAQSYENLFSMNGAVIQENIRGTAYPLYIEDALQEVTVSAAGVSAEYGRFEGGMVTAITKSGGNDFSGSFRTSLMNDYWRATAPSDDPKSDPKALEPATNPMYEVTFGGPVQRERIWFFGATRLKDEETARTTSITNVPYIRVNEEKRYEGKVTVSPRAAHSIQASYINIDQVQTNFSPQNFNVMDTASLVDQRQPSDLFSVRYTGIVSPRLSLEVQYSRRDLTLDSGAQTRDKIDGTLMIDSARNTRYWSPTFCGICEDETRDNDNFVAKGSYFLSTGNGGAHQLVFGYDRFNDKIFQNAYQSGSDYRIMGTTSIIGADGTIYPQLMPLSTMIMYNPVEQKSQGSDLRMHSLFLNDNWRFNGNLTFNLGIRWDKNQAQDGGSVVVANKGAWSPRLAAIWDPTGDGRWTFNGSYARYVMPMTSNVAASTTAAGNASTYVWQYQGAPINADPNAPLTRTEAAIEQVFAWFDANGGTGRTTVGSFVPGVNVQIASPLKSPYAHEYAFGTSRQVSSRGTIRVDGIFRTYHDFYSQRADMDTGKVTDNLGNRYDLFLVENTNAVKRQYSGLTTQFNYRAMSGLDLGGNYTLSRLWGNFDGETASAGPTVAQVESFPEYKMSAWNSPEGDLAADQRHRARLWATYLAPLSERAGSLTFGLLQQVGSGVPYGAVGLVNAAPFVTNPGYLAPQGPTNGVDYYFTARDAFRTEATYRTDLSVNYGYRIGGRVTAPELFVHGELLNIFNQFQLCGCGASASGNGGATDLSTIGQSVRTSRNAPTVYQPFNPFTTTPVQGVNWDYNAALNSEFGSALSHLAYTMPRTFRFSVGIRF